ncbi:Fatty acid hydroxylase [Cynara cardunculus var. scolymus]|uniref:Fatty acid hydroxylase n=1 Tax=Cynara cardunculus var. scolymus TaxID=59895 RepID=A0A103YAI7_CYNCS|nr:Fatty acid hydroxylase [Cynara cardunculus var. scolymus]
MAECIRGIERAVPNPVWPLCASDPAPASLVSAWIFVIGVTDSKRRHHSLMVGATITAAFSPPPATQCSSPETLTALRFLHPERMPEPLTLSVSAPALTLCITVESSTVEKSATLAVTTLQSTLASLGAYPFALLGLPSLLSNACLARNELFSLVEKLSISNKSELASLAASLCPPFLEISITSALGVTPSQFNMVSFLSRLNDFFPFSKTGEPNTSDEFSRAVILFSRSTCGRSCGWFPSGIEELSTGKVAFLRGLRKFNGEVVLWVIQVGIHESGVVGSFVCGNHSRLLVVIKMKEEEKVDMEKGFRNLMIRVKGIKSFKSRNGDGDGDGDGDCYIS